MYKFYFKSLKKYYQNYVKFVSFRKKIFILNE